MAGPLISRAHVVLEAVNHAANSDIQSLRQLTTYRPDALTLDTTLRILLTYLPVGTEPAFYTEFLRDLPVICSQNVQQLSHNSHAPLLHDITEDEARNRVRRLHLVPLVNHTNQHDKDADSLTLFLLHQAHRIDAETGSLELASQLLEPFVDHSEILRTWMISNLLPLLRLDYEYYPHSRPTYSLSEFEKLEEGSAVQMLLSKAVQRIDPGDTQKIGRDLRGLVGPWMYGERSRKRRKLSHKGRRKSSITSDGPARGQDTMENINSGSEWSHVNAWLVELSVRDFQKTVDAATQWNGPSDIDYGEWGNGSLSLQGKDLDTATRRYAQAALASLYATTSASMETIVGSHRTLLQVARLLGHDEPADLKRIDMPVVSGISQDFLGSLSPAQLLHNSLLLPQNPVTMPTQHSINVFNVLLASTYKLLNLGTLKTIRAVAELAFFSSEADQVAELRRTLHKLKAEKMDDGLWASVRGQMLWLRNWEQESTTGEEPRGVFSKVTKVDLEVELLRAMLDGGCHKLAAEVYCKPIDDAPLPMETVENTALAAALSAYDAASNGNRHRGGVRKASEITSTFRKFFPSSLTFEQISALLSATHAMSFYSLTLHHGVPFQPVNIRAHKDPLVLIGKILSQNAQSYTHLDDLLEIGQNLVAAGLTQQSEERRTKDGTDVNSKQEFVIATRRITRMAIEAALEEDDFDTAYSYIVNRLSQSQQPKLNGSDELGGPFARQDDISWRAAYQAGRFSKNSLGNSTLRRLEQRLELLSQALILAPAAALSEVLTTWQKCEQDIITQIAQEALEDEKWNEKGDRKVPGGFATDSGPTVQKARDPTRGALVEEAPLGLFEVARGAAAALSKSTFPLRNMPQSGPKSPLKATNGRRLSTASAGSSDEGSISGAGGTGRVRKRDMVSSMVTGGLVSGIGWVIGES